MTDTNRTSKTKLELAIELLTELKGIFAGDAAPHWVNRMETTMLRGRFLDHIDYVLGMRQDETNGDESPTVEVWRGKRKVTVYKDTVIRVWGPHIDHDMSDEPRTLESMQKAFDWLYSAEEPTRNQAAAAPSDAGVGAPTPRGSLPNSLGTGGAGSHPAASSAESPLARAIRIARGDTGPPTEPVRFAEKASERQQIEEFNSVLKQPRPGKPEKAK